VRAVVYVRVRTLVEIEQVVAHESVGVAVGQHGHQTALVRDIVQNGCAAGNIKNRHVSYVRRRLRVGRGSWLRCSGSPGGPNCLRPAAKRTAMVSATDSVADEPDTRHTRPHVSAAS